MAAKLLARSAIVPLNPINNVRYMSDLNCYFKNMIGRREVVGFGFNGHPVYIDRTDFPMPAIRWKESNCEIECLREKEKDDWGKLSVVEKKALYRSSFCQTFSEMKAPSGEWKSILGISLFLFSAGLWMVYLAKTVYSPFPESFKQENREAQLRRILDLKTNPIEGLASRYDYEKDDWK